MAKLIYFVHKIFRHRYNVGYSQLSELISESPLSESLQALLPKLLGLLL